MAARASWYQCEMSVSSNLSDELHVAAAAAAAMRSNRASQSASILHIKKAALGCLAGS